MLNKGSFQLLKPNCKQLPHNFSVCTVLSCAITHVQTGLQSACFMVQIVKPAKIYTYKKALCVSTTPARLSNLPTLK